MLLMNPNTSLDFYLQQLLPVIFSCTVAAKIGFSSSEDHWALRRKAAEVIATICNKYGDFYPDIHARVCKTYLDAMSADKTYTTVYGGLVGLATMGNSAFCSGRSPKR